MRAAYARSIASGGRGDAQSLWWLQAGFSLAYRLAHLSVPRSVTVCALALLLYVS